MASISAIGAEGFLAVRSGLVALWKSKGVERISRNSATLSSATSAAVRVGRAKFHQPFSHCARFQIIYSSNTLILQHLSLHLGHKERTFRNPSRVILPIMWMEQKGKGTNRSSQCLAGISLASARFDDLGAIVERKSTRCHSATRTRAEHVVLLHLLAKKFHVVFASSF